MSKISANTVFTNAGGVVGTGIGVSTAAYAISKSAGVNSMAAKSIILGMGAAGALSGLTLGHQYAGEDSISKKFWTTAITTGVSTAVALGVASSLPLASHPLAMPMAAAGGIVGASLVTGAILAWT